jgi:uncharacterized protein (DUF1800 family)
VATGTNKALGAAIAVTRFGLGARPGELALAAGDPRGWLGDQLQPSLARREPKPDRKLLSGPEITRKMLALRPDRQSLSDRARQQAQKEFQEAAREIYLAEATARVARGVESGTPFLERLVRFWTNHFTVTAGKPLTTPLVGPFEREAIRPNVLGRFHDLLLAAESHPAMILYLDNHISFGPNSMVGRRRNKGLNENLAREILELHTLGVDGGYGQEDVTGFARILTGWTVMPRQMDATRAGTFKFIDRAHEPGAHFVLGKRYGQAGEDQPRAVLADLARHPATARHIAVKLARHFIADAPPAGAVDALAGVFIETDGDLLALGRTLVALDDAWGAEQRKFKPPEDYLVSVLRAVPDLPFEPRQPVRLLELMGQRPYAAPSPAGWPDDEQHWASPDGLMKRIEFADFVARTVRGRDAVALAGTSLGALAAPDLLRAIGRAESRRQGVALLLASPQFMRR